MCHFFDNSVMFHVKQSFLQKSGFYELVYLIVLPCDYLSRGVLLLVRVILFLHYLFLFKAYILTEIHLWVCSVFMRRKKAFQLCISRLSVSWRCMDYRLHATFMILEKRFTWNTLIIGCSFRMPCVIFLVSDVQVLCV